MELEGADGEWGFEVQGWGWGVWGDWGTGGLGDWGTGGLEDWEVWEVWGDGEALFTKPLATKPLNHFLKESQHHVEFNMTISKLT